MFFELFVFSFEALSIYKVWQMFYLIKRKRKTCFFHLSEVQCIQKLSSCNSGCNLILLADQTPVRLTVIPTSVCRGDFKKRFGDFKKDLAPLRLAHTRRVLHSRIRYQYWLMNSHALLS